ncbi:2-amino-4-hydroxy-6-hydroxymethyldihydropteridine diphosphokinase [Caloramator sp. E03]|uniref:2-amino-4-hydroxy-6- hydroxymethyldihydropteridine diphosphokinase n=1 Tax=Caloramator sp. E03 TaxID=2576307 RepID=UPI001110DD9C|nr:2-amino-4-hydroxy-6-hydroxymethyldihydropteridine diphosphokinase [Caloramator sp. E03]QCX32882.1 2-amino-4-hydroxy-6-hydroxymethyldihydropteridine diphosphokinase [Caloramator sp. E03]
MNRVYVAFGSNIGDKNKNIKKAIEMMNARGLNVIKISQIYKTEPYGYTNQPEFLNGVLEALTDLDAMDVLYTLLNIEKDLGRVREFKWGPRIIDLDILFFNDDVIDEKDLKVPHPDMQNREFVLKPLCEIAPNFMHPVLKKSVKDMLLELELKNK